MPISIEKDINGKRWYINLGKNTNMDIEKIKRELLDDEVEFIDSIVEEIGEDVLKYWSADPRTEKGKNEMKDIVDKISNKYLIK